MKGRKSKKIEAIYTKRLDIRIDDKAYQRLKYLSENSLLSMSEIIRRLIMGDVIRFPPPADYYNLCQELHAIGNNINQIARVANATGQLDKVAFKENMDFFRESVLRIQTAVLLGD